MTLPAPLSLSPPPFLLSTLPSARHLPASLKASLSPSCSASNRLTTRKLGLRCTHTEGRWTVKASTSEIPPSEGNEAANEILDGWEAKGSNLGISFLAKLAIALGIAATTTLGSIYLKWFSSGSSFSLPLYIASSSQSGAASVGFTFTFFRYKVIIPEFTPGWVYFWLLMAAGCGLFISEEALNVWVGISLARNLTLDGSWQSLVESFSRRAPYIVSTVLWVYWGVCISDMIPFYLGRFFRLAKVSEDICNKLGIGKEKAVEISCAVRKYGNLIGFVERFALGARNPTAFLAGASGISAECFFAGVCCGGLITLPIQLAVGFLLRKRPVVALATVTTAVGFLTAFPYLLATITAVLLYLRQQR